MLSESITINHYVIPFFILNSIILFYSDRDTFGKVMLVGDEYYKFYQIYTWSSVSLLINTILYLTIVCCCGKKRKMIENCSNCYDLSYFVVCIIQLCVMANIWHNNPDYTVLFYKPFWNEPYVHFPNDYDGIRWVYQMSDIVFRIQSFVVIISLMIAIGLILIIGCIGPIGRGIRRGSDSPRIISI